MYRSGMSAAGVDRSVPSMPRFVPNLGNPDCPDRSHGVSSPRNLAGPHRLRLEVMKRVHPSDVGYAVRYLWLACPNLSNLTLYCTCRCSNVSRVWHCNLPSPPVNKQCSMSHATGHEYPYMTSQTRTRQRGIEDEQTSFLGLLLAKL